MGNPFENPQPVAPDSKKEKGSDLTLKTADHPEDVARYVRFEMEQGWLAPSGEETADDCLDKYSRIRQEQIDHNALKVILAFDDKGEVAGASDIVLLNGIKGKKLAPNEAHSAGTVVREDCRGQGIGRKIAAEQETVARQAGKEFLNAHIAANNPASMRMRMAIGYRLNGVYDPDQDGPDYGELNYKYQKDLTAEEAVVEDWKKAVESGQLGLTEGELDESSPGQILIDPDNSEQVAQALENGYQGVSLLRPNDFEGSPPIDKNLIVFARKQG